MRYAELRRLVGRRVRGLAEQRGLRLPELAHRARIDETRLQACLDDSADIELDEIAMLAHALDVPPTELLVEG